MSAASFDHAASFVRRMWPKIAKQIEPDNVVFVRGRKVALLGHAHAIDVAELLGIKQTIILRLRANANKYGQWLIVVDETGKAGAFVIEKPNERRPTLQRLGREVNHVEA